MPSDPVQVVAAGKLGLADGSTCSYVAYGFAGIKAEGVWGLKMTLWYRESWMDKPRGSPRQGIAASFRIEPPELRNKFTVGKASWGDGQKKILRVPYTLGELKGVIEIHCGGKDYPWPIHPDRGCYEA